MAPTLFLKNGVKRGEDDPAARAKVDKTLFLKSISVYVAVVLDLMVGAYTDVVYTESSSLFVMATIFQACTFLLTTMCFYNVLAETVPAKRAMFTRLAEEFRPTFMLGLANFMLLLAVRFYRLALIYSYYAHTQVWEQPAYMPLYVIFKVTTLAYYSSLMWSMQVILNSPELFTTP